MSALTSLERLYLMSNSLTEVPAAIKGMVSLKQLVLSQNKDIKEIPAWIFDLPQLEHIDLSGTSVSVIPESLESAGNLKFFVLNKAKVPDEVHAELRKTLPDCRFVF